MEILVCLKQVPGTSNVEVDPQTGVLRRDGVESKMNPYDLFSLELALRLRERYGGSVRVLTMGPPQAGAVIREAVSMGADGGVVLSDRRFAGADVLATSYTLSQGIRAMGKFDLVLCGKQTTDGDTAQVGAEVAEFLGIPHAGNVAQVEEVADGRVTVRVNLDDLILRESLPLPCLLCADSDINTPRLPSYKRLKAAEGEEIPVRSLESLEDRDEKHYGLTGSPTQVERIFPPQHETQRVTLEGTGKEQAAQLAALLKERKFY